MSLDERFSEVAQKVKSGSKSFTGEQSLAFFSLYKQATSGDVNIDEPTDEAEKAKYTAWASCKGLSSNEAKEKYIALAEQVLS